jgi:hypothetical protein
MPPTDATLGFRAHSGWAVLVAVAGGAPLFRQRVAMGKVPQPFHMAAEMQMAQAETLLKRTEKAAVAMAVTGIREALARLAADGYRASGAAVLLASGKPLPELAKILAAHPLIHTAEGVFFRDVLKSACAECGLAAAGVRERDLPADLVARVSGFGKILGPPWTQDEKLATAAAISVYTEGGGGVRIGYRDHAASARRGKV